MTPENKTKTKRAPETRNDRQSQPFSFHRLTHVSSSHFAAAIVPQAGQRRLSSSVIQRSMSGLRSLPRSVTWNDSSRMTEGDSCRPGAWQYQRKRSCRLHKKGHKYLILIRYCLVRSSSHLPIDVSGRTLSTTIPTVSAKRTGL